MYFSVQSRCFDPPQSIYGPQKGASREDIVNMAHWM